MRELVTCVRVCECASCGGCSNWLSASELCTGIASVFASAKPRFLDLKPDYSYIDNRNGSQGRPTVALGHVNIMILTGRSGLDRQDFASF